MTDNVVFLSAGPPAALVPWLEGIAKDGGSAFVARAEATNIDAMPTTFLIVIRDALEAIATGKGRQAAELRRRAQVQSARFRQAVLARPAQGGAACQCFGDTVRCVAEPVRYLKQNGYEARRYCRLVGRMVGGALPRGQVPAGAQVVAYRRPEQRCAACGTVGLSEVHHLAPRARFLDADAWPVAPLCPPCHQRWHEEADLVSDWRRNLRRLAALDDDRCAVCASTERLVLMQWLWYAESASLTSVLCAAHADLYCSVMRGYRHSAPSTARAVPS